MEEKKNSLTLASPRENVFFVCVCVFGLILTLGTRASQLTLASLSSGCKRLIRSGSLLYYQPVSIHGASMNLCIPTSYIGKIFFPLSLCRYQSAVLNAEVGGKLP